MGGPANGPERGPPDLHPSGHPRSNRRGDFLSDTFTVRRSGVRSSSALPKSILPYPPTSPEKSQYALLRNDRYPGEGRGKPHTHLNRSLILLDLNGLAGPLRRVAAFRPRKVCRWAAKILAFIRALRAAGFPPVPPQVPPGARLRAPLRRPAPPTVLVPARFGPRAGAPSAIQVPAEHPESNYWTTNGNASVPRCSRGTTAGLGSAFSTSPFSARTMS
jgi:hypothetical protein